MKIAITGGTGFVGRNLARRLVSNGHHVVLIARGKDCSDQSIRLLPNCNFAPLALDNIAALTEAFCGCTAVVHCAGINRAIGNETFHKVHVEGTRHVIDCARAAGVKKLVLMSFLRTRPDCGSPYHESKWAAEELVRGSGLDYTIFKAGVIYGPGDHMLDHLSHAFCTFPMFAFVGFKDRAICPVAVEDLTRLLEAAIVEDVMKRKTVAVLGPEQLMLRQAVRRVASVVGRSPLMFPLPVWFHYALGYLIERIMVIPMVSVAQVRMLTEGVAEACTPCDLPPAHLAPSTPFSTEQIRKGLPPPKGFGLHDLLWFRRTLKGVTP